MRESRSSRETMKTFSTRRKYKKTTIDFCD
jgi:hypothetical protein